MTIDDLPIGKTGDVREWDIRLEEPELVWLPGDRLQEIQKKTDEFYKSLFIDLLNELKPIETQGKDKNDIPLTFRRPRCITTDWRSHVKGHKKEDE